MLTMDPTYLIQFDDDNGGWEWYSQHEHESAAEAREFARGCYGGEVEFRIVRVERTVIEDLDRSTP